MQATTKHLTACEFALQNLRRSILEGRLAPGQELDAQGLAASMGMSRTPVREAIKILEVQGFASQRRFGTPVVSPLSERHIEEVYLIRKSLEGLATYYASTRIQAAELEQLKQINRELHIAAVNDDPVTWSQLNRTFHRRLYAPCGKALLCQYIESLMDMAAFYMMALAKYVRPRVEESAQEHAEILSACENRDPDLAQHLLEKHMVKGVPMLVDYVRARDNELTKQGGDGDRHVGAGPQV
jgi:DNA-binding GntR family transcriptional regulator